MTPLLFDIIIIALVLLSVGLGFMRGFCNEVFTILGWIGAILATLYFTPEARHFTEGFIHKTWLAGIVTAAVIFLVTLGVFSAVSHFATRTLHASKLGIVDRSLGFGFGIIRAVIILGLGFLLFAYVYGPDDRPDFVQKSRTRPFLEASAHWVESLLPGKDHDIKISEGDPDPIEKVVKPKVEDKGAPPPDSAAPIKPDDTIKNELQRPDELKPAASSDAK